jgi:hypothetical protein
MQNNFIENYLWLFVIVILLFTCFVGYILNKHIDPNEIEEEDEEEDINLNGTHNED